MLKVLVVYEISFKKAENIVFGNDHITTSEITDDLRISVGRSYVIFSEYKCSKYEAFVKKVSSEVLNFDQKNCRMNVVQDLLKYVFHNINTLKGFICGEEP